MSEWKVDNYISCSSLKGHTHITVIGIFTRQPPRKEEGGGGGGAEEKDKCYISSENKRRGGGGERDPWPFHRRMQWLFIELIFRGSEVFMERYITLNGAQPHRGDLGATNGEAAESHKLLQTMQ